MWSGFSITILHWPGLFRAKLTQLCVEVLLLSSLPSQCLREDLMRAIDTVMPTYSMRIVGQGAGLHNTDSVTWGWLDMYKGHWGLGSVFLDFSFPPA